MNPCLLLVGATGLGLLMPTGTRAQDSSPSSGPRVTYVSASSVYVGVGSAVGMAIGDTVWILHPGKEPVVLVVSAVSSSSLAARYQGNAGGVMVGDSVAVQPSHPTFRPPIMPLPPETTAHATGVKPPPAPPPAPPTIVPSPHGRIAIQYAGAGVVGKRMDYSQPAVVLHLRVPEVGSLPITLSVYGRTYYDASPVALRYGQGSRLRYRLYDFSLSSSEPSTIGWSAGRITSQYVGSFGQTDGVQAGVSKDNMTIGVLAGLQPDYETSHPDADQQKIALFTNFRWGDEAADRKDVTVAYGKQLHKGRLDRDFLSVQGIGQWGPALFVYATSEFDLHDLRNGAPKESFHLTNTFLSVSYLPVEWITVNGGYDATRSIYLFDSMRSLADSLIDREVRQGFRTSLTFRLPWRLTAGLNGSFRLKTENTRAASTLGVSVRSFQILDMPVGAGATYARIVGSYTDGDDITLNADWWVSQMISATVRLDRYVYHLTWQPTHYRTTTLSGMVNVRFAPMWYSMVSLDQLWDSLRNSQRIFLEVGLQF